MSTTIPVIANRAPWNELVLRGRRKVKTLSFNWKHRGPILLYTSSNRVDWWAEADYPMLRNIPNSTIPKGVIVGYATVKDVVPTSELPAGFRAKDPGLTHTLGQSYVAIVTKVKRFKRPIPFKPPKGAIRIFRAPASFLRRATI
jgi:hypothetical protein